MSRVKPKEFWEKHVLAFHKSKMSQREYCRKKGLKHRSLHYHLRRNRLTEPVNSHSLEKHSGWLPMTVIDEPTRVNSGGVRIQISRITIDAEQGCDGTLLANMLRAVGAVC